jgi:hypothetical protein
LVQGRELMWWFPLLFRLLEEQSPYICIIKPIVLKWQSNMN